MDNYELKKEQLRLAPKIILKDNFEKINKVAGIYAAQYNKQIKAFVIVCEFPSFKILEKKSYTLDDPLAVAPEFNAYREMPAMIEAYNQLEIEPDLILVKGPVIAHPRKIGIASHLGLALNKPTLGVTDKLIYGNIEQGKIIINNEIRGFEVKTREYANPLYLSPGYMISLGSSLDLISKMIVPPHKLPEPLYLAHRFASKGKPSKSVMNSIPEISTLN